jgi:hypothetical protein
MSSVRVPLDHKIRFIITVPDWRPEEASLFQGFAYSLCKNSGLLRLVRQMPSDILELTPERLPIRVARRIAGQTPINWFGQSPRALKSHPIPLATPFTVIMLDESEIATDYDEWRAKSPGIPTLIASKGGDLAYSELSLASLQKRFLDVCAQLEGTELDDLEAAAAAIAAWKEPEERELAYEIGGHGTIFPNASVLNFCGYRSVGREPYSRHGEGEPAHIEQIVLTTTSVLDEREANPLSVANRVFPRSPDMNLFCPATYDFRSAFELRPEVDRAVRREMQIALKLLEKQSSYFIEAKTEAQHEVMIGLTSQELLDGGEPMLSPAIAVRQQEVWMSVEAVSCLAVSEVSSVVRLPNRMNHSRGAVRQFAQHYRADRPQILKRSELFRGVQRMLANGFPVEFRELLDRSVDGLRIIADAHIEWLDIDGFPLGLRYNVSRIPVTPGNLFIDLISAYPVVQATPEDFYDVLVVSGLPEADIVARQFQIAFEHFGQIWEGKLRLKVVRVSSRQELIDAINAFEGMIMVFDGHGSHHPDYPGMLWLGEEALDVWDLRGEISRPPPVVILSACDTHAADRNHATVANGLLALGCRAVLASVFPLHASQAAVFTARLLYRVAEFVPAAVKILKRSLTWLEVVSGMLRRQLTTDILQHLEDEGLISQNHSEGVRRKVTNLADFGGDDPLSEVHQALLDYGIPPEILARELSHAIASSSTISYLHMGRPETILINTIQNVKDVAELDAAPDA